MLLANVLSARCNLFTNMQLVWGPDDWSVWPSTISDRFWLFMSIVYVDMKCIMLRIHYNRPQPFMCPITMARARTDMEVTVLANSALGYNSLKEHQIEVVLAVAGGRDVCKSSILSNSDGRHA